MKKKKPKQPKSPLKKGLFVLDQKGQVFKDKWEKRKGNPHRQRDEDGMTDGEF